MHFDLRLWAGVLGGVLNVAGLAPYIRDIFRHKTKPERAMWWIYTVLFALLFWAQRDAGARYLLIITAAYALTAAIIAVLSVKYGYGSFHKRDLISLGIAALGLALWQATNSPLFAIFMVIVVDFAGFWLTLVKTWCAPHSETLISWQLSFAAAVLSVISSGTWKFTIIMYPIYAVLGTLLLVWLIIYRRRLIKTDPVDF